MSVIVEDLILPSIVQVGVRLEENRPYKNFGSTYSVLPEVGDGFYWVFGFENQFAVVVYNITLRETVRPHYRHPAFYTIGSYDNSTASHINGRINPTSRILLGYSRPEAVYHDVLHKDYCGKGISISLSAPYAKETAESFGLSIDELSDRCFSLNGTERIPDAITVLRQVERYTPTERFANRYYESKLMELLAILCQRHEPAYPKLPKSNLRSEEKDNICRVTDFIRAHYVEPIDSYILSAIAFMGRTKLTQAFKQVHGVTITQYVRQLRIEHAKSLLKEDRLSLGQIADRVGYHTQGSFTDLFKKATGLTPREYRHLFSDNQS